MVEENNIVAVLGRFEEIGEQSNVKLIEIGIVRRETYCRGCSKYRTFGLRRLSRLRKFLQTQIFWYRWIAILKILGYAYLRIVSTAKLIVLWVVETTDPKRDYAAKKRQKF